MTANTTKIYEQWRQYQYYVIITVISLVALFFLPMVGSSVGLAWQLPNTGAGWVVYVVSKLLVATLNILIFHCFNLQARINVKDNVNYIAANEILTRSSLSRTVKARSPAEFNSNIYGKKGISIFFISIVSAVGLTQAVLAFDWISMLTYFFTILMGVIFGILQMNQTEIYWTEEYYRYALDIQAEEEEEALRMEEEKLALAAQEHLEQRDDTASNTGGDNLLVSSNSGSASCPNS